jgi:hypothetical protein
MRNTVDLSSSASEDSGLWDSGDHGGGGLKGLDEEGLEFQTQPVTVNRQALMELDKPEVAEEVMKVAPHSRTAAHSLAQPPNPGEPCSACFRTTRTPPRHF